MPDNGKGAIWIDRTKPILAFVSPKFETADATRAARTMRQIAFAARWMPGGVRKRMRTGFRALGD